MFNIENNIHYIYEGFTVYGLMIISGFLFAGIWGWFAVKKYNLVSENVIIVEAYVIIFALFFAKILYVIVNVGSIPWEQLNNAEIRNALVRGGFVYYGGFIGGVIALPVVYKLHRIAVIKYIEIMIPALPFAQGLGRIGCHTAGCCYGIPYNGIFHVVYNHKGSPLNGLSLFPVQLLESVCCFMLAAALIIFVLKHSKPTPKSIYVYLYGYGIIRFIIEFFRYDGAERGIYLGLSTSQWISICLITAASIMIVYNKRIIDK